MYNLRYHLASLVSVFLALALGLVLGGLIVQRGTFDKQGASLVEGLRKEFTDLRVENRTLKTQNAELSSLSTAMVDKWTSGRLAGRTIVVVSNAGRSDGRQAATDAIEQAGGSVANVTLLQPEFGLTGKDATAVTSAAPDPERPLQSIAASLAAEWTAPNSQRPLTDALVAEGVLSIDGLPKSGVSGIVDIASADGKSDPAGIALVSSAVDHRTDSAAGQTPMTDTGVASAAADAGLPALDTLGTVTGRYTLVALLSGAKSGYYGSASGADALFPPLAEVP